jgi:gamma-aminobutyric acid type B receptor
LVNNASIAARTQARLAGLIGPKYVWIMHYGNNPRWMDQGTDDGLCTADDIKEAADDHLVICDVTLREDDVIPLSGLVSY